MSIINAAIKSKREIEVKKRKCAWKAPSAAEFVLVTGGLCHQCKCRVFL